MSHARDITKPMQRKGKSTACHAGVTPMSRRITAPPQPRRHGAPQCRHRREGGAIRSRADLGAATTLGLIDGFFWVPRAGVRARPEPKESTMTTTNLDTETPQIDRAAEEGVLLGADLLRELLALARTAQQQSQASLQSAVEMRDGAMTLITQLAEIARDGITHLDADEYEITRFTLAFIASAPARLGIAPVTGRTQ